MKYQDEYWKDISGYEGRYQVSNKGRVRSLQAKTKTKPYKGGVLTLMTDSMGYKLVNLSRKSYKVHRLVAAAFIENPNGLPCINHKDEDKTNNNAENLEWCTHRYNNNYGTRNARISQNEGRGIIQYNLDGIEIKRWRSSADAARHYGVSRSSIYGCCSKRQHTSCGYVWRFADE